MNQDITYRIKTAAYKDIFTILKHCDNDFIPPLSERVNLEAYATKIYEKSITFEAWKINELIGLIAVYLNNTSDSIGYITNVCVNNKYKNQKIAYNLMRSCIKFASENGFSNLSLEVNEKSIPAINLYRKMNFSESERSRENIKMNLSL